jgi:hypothetical protein
MDTEILNKPNPATYIENYSPSPSGINPRDIRLV